MATTTNYGWTTPDDTALVKDGASAIRTLGSSVDTTTKNLNPETTLADIAYRSSTSNVNTRLGIGSTGQVLTVAGGVPSWATPAAGGGWTLISTTNITGTSTSLGSFSGYKNLWLVIANWTSTSDESRGINPNGNASITSGTFIERSIQSRWDVAGLQLNTAASILAAGNFAYNVFIWNYADTTRFKNFMTNGFYVNATSQKTANMSAGVIETNSAITTLDVYGGTTALTGTILLYGGN